MHAGGVGFVGGAPDGEAATAEVAFEIAPEFAEKDVALAFIDAQGIGDKSLLVDGSLHAAREIEELIGEAGAAKAAAGVEIVGADARVGGEALAHEVDVDTNAFAERGHLVHETHARGEHGVDATFDQLSGSERHQHDFTGAARHWP